MTAARERPAHELVQTLDRLAEPRLRPRVDVLMEDAVILELKRVEEIRGSTRHEDRR